MKKDFNQMVLSKTKDDLFAAQEAYLFARGWRKDGDKHYTTDHIAWVFPGDKVLIKKAMDAQEWQEWLEYYTSSQQARTAFVEICALAGSDVVAEENAILSIGREFLPEFALKVLDKIDLSAREEIEYYEWLTDSVQAAMDEHANTLACGHEWHELDNN
jgi:hypothetical protein